MTAKTLDKHKPDGTVIKAPKQSRSKESLSTESLSTEGDKLASEEFDAAAFEAETKPKRGAKK